MNGQVAAAGLQFSQSEVSSVSKSVQRSEQEGNGPIDERAAIVSRPILISNLNYPGVYVYVAILVTSEAMLASRLPQGHI